MAEQLTKEQIADYQRLLENEKTQKEIDSDKWTACGYGAVGGAVGGGLVTLGNPAGVVVGAGVGCLTGIGGAVVYHDSGADQAVKAIKVHIEDIKDYYNKMSEKPEDPKLNALEGLQINDVRPSSLPVSIKSDSSPKR